MTSPAVLLAALRRLRNEVHGLIGIAAASIREGAGNTNFECLKLRVAEADQVIVAFEKGQKEAAPPSAEDEALISLAKEAAERAADMPNGEAGPGECEPKDTLYWRLAERLAALSHLGQPSTEDEVTISRKSAELYKTLLERATYLEREDLRHELDIAMAIGPIKAAGLALSRQPDRDAVIEVNVVFDGPPGPKSGRFIEVENAAGESIRLGDWIHCDDGRGGGYWKLRFRALESHPVPQPQESKG